MTLTSEDVAARLHSTPSTVRRMAREGRLAGSFVGRRWIFTEDALAELLAATSNREQRPARRRRRRTA